MIYVFVITNGLLWIAFFENATKQLKHFAVTDYFRSKKNHGRAIRVISYIFILINHKSETLEQGFSKSSVNSDERV